MKNNADSKMLLLDLIKSISNGNHRVIAGKGIIIHKADINHGQLAEHRDAIGELCVELGNKMTHNEDRFITQQVASFTDDGEFSGMKDEQTYKLNNKGYEMKESIWFGKADSDDVALDVL